MNHWQLVIQDIWSVARYAMPLVSSGIFGLLAFKIANHDEERLLVGAWAVSIVIIWGCMAGYL